MSSGWAAKMFRITGTLVTEPDRLASGFGPGMRVLMSRAGLERTGLIQFGSRAAQRFLFKLKPNVDLDAMKAQLKSALPRVFISDYREGSPVVGKAIDNTTTFLSLISLIALIVGSLGVAMAMYSHLQQRMDTIAVMKAVGARAGQIMQIYLMQTLWLGVAGGLIGVAVGALVQKSFPWLIQRVFALLPEVPWDWSFSLQGMSLGVLATLLFTLPPLLSIRNVRPSLVLSPEHGRCEHRKPQSIGARSFPSIAGALLILAGFSGIAVWLSGSWRMGRYFIAGLSVQHFTVSRGCRCAACRHALDRASVEQASAPVVPAWLCKSVPARKPGPICSGGVGDWGDVHAEHLPAAEHGSCAR